MLHIFLKMLLISTINSNFLCKNVPYIKDSTILIFIANYLLIPLHKKTNINIAKQINKSTLLRATINIL